MQRVVSILFILFICNNLFAQDRVVKNNERYYSSSNNYRDISYGQPGAENIEDLVRNDFLGGGCLEIKDVTYVSEEQSGRTLQIGNFVASDDLQMGFEQGLILSTGNVRSASGPNIAENTTGSFNNAGDSDLEMFVS